MWVLFSNFEVKPSEGKIAGLPLLLRSFFLTLVISRGKKKVYLFTSGDAHEEMRLVHRLQGCFGD